MTAALTTDGLTKKYGRRTALSECTLAVPAGRLVGLVSPNGAGKSTLLQAGRVVVEAGHTGALST